MFQSLSVTCLAIVGMFGVSQEWTNDYAQALDAARKAKRPMVVVLEDPSHSKLRADSLLGVRRDLLRQFEVCRVDATSKYGTKVAELYGATELPYAVVTDEKCKNILFRGAGQFSSELWNETLRNYTVKKRNAGLDNESDALALPVDSLEEKAPFVHANLNAALTASQERKVPSVVVVSMDNCHFCDKLQDVTFQDDSLRTMIASRFESVVIKKKDNETWVSGKNVSIFPTTFVLSPAGMVLDRIEGFVEPHDMRARLGVIGSELYSHR